MVKSVGGLADSSARAAPEDRTSKPEPDGQGRAGSTHTSCAEIGRRPDGTVVQNTFASPSPQKLLVTKLIPAWREAILVLAAWLVGILRREFNYEKIRRVELRNREWGR